MLTINASIFCQNSTEALNMTVGNICLAEISQIMAMIYVNFLEFDDSDITFDDEFLLIKVPLREYRLVFMVVFGN